MRLSQFLLTDVTTLFYFFTTVASSNYVTMSNLTHTCRVRPVVVCVDVAVLNQTCVDVECLITSGGNQSACLIPLITSNLTIDSNFSASNTSNTTSSNTTMTITTCNGTRVHPDNTSLCLNATTWSKTVCEVNNVTCKINSTKCTQNPVFYIGGFFNLKHLDGWGNLPAAELAIEEVNNNPGNLSNITLSLIAKESTQGLLSHGTQLLYTYLNSGPPKLMLLLPQGDDLARTVSAYAGLKRWGTLQFSYGTTDNSLASNKNLFPRFFRLNPLEISYNRLRVAFVRSFPNWKYDIGLLYFSNTYYEEVNNDLHERLKAKGFKIVANVGFRSTPEEAVDILKAKNAHIILTSFPYTYGKKLFCKAYKMGMYGPHYVWITYDLMPIKFWVPSPNDNLDCSEYEMTCTAENHFSFTGATLNLGGLVSKNATFSKTYYDLVDVGNSTKNRSSLAAYTYDAVWTIANILQRARKEVEGSGKNLSELSYEDTEQTKLFAKLAYETDFTGTTGRIRFFENGNRKFAMSVLQVRSSGVGHYVGKYDVDSDVYTPSNIKWQGGLPYERTTASYQWRNIDLVLFVFWCILAVLGILFAFFCFCFVIKYRRNRSIKHSSPTINLCIILGCLLNFITVILYGVDYQRASEARVTTLCKVRLWLFSLGFTLCIGGLLVKVWTLYQILIERRVLRKRVMEYWMFGIVSTLIIIDLIYLTTWTVTDGLYRSVETVIDQPVYQCFQTISGNPFRVATTYIEICDCDNMASWLGIFLAYKALMLLYGLYMSWKVRTVYTRKLIDAQYCATLLIIALPFCIFGIIFAFSLRLYPTPHYALVGIIIIIYSVIVLVVLFGHKIMNILFPPVIKVHSKGSATDSHCCLIGLCTCLAPLIACCSAFTAAFCCCCCCCQGLWKALLRGPKQTRGSLSKASADKRMDYQIGDMPGDREKQIIILRKELEKKEKYLSQLKGLQRSTQAAKQTQTTSFVYNNRVNNEGSETSSSGLSNESFEDDSGEKNRIGRHRHNRFKIYHRKLDFSHVSSKVDSGLDGKSSTRNVPAETPPGNRSYESSPNSKGDAEVQLLQRSLCEKEKELNQLKAYLGIYQSSVVEPSSRRGSLASIGEESAIPDRKGKGTMARESGCDGNNSVILSLYPDNIYEDKSTDVTPTKSSVSQKSYSNVDDSPEYSAKSAYLGLGQDMTVSSSEVKLQPTNVTAEDECVHQDITDRQQTSVMKGEGQRNNFKGANQSKQDAERKLSEMVISSPYSSVPSNGRKPGRFQKKIRQLNTLGVFRTNGNPTIKVEPYSDSSARDPTQHGGDADFSGTSKSDNLQGKPRSIDEHSNPNTNAPDLSENEKSPGLKTTSDKESYLMSRNNVVILDAPSDYSHVKSRLFAPSPNTNSVNGSSAPDTPTSERRSKADDENVSNGKVDAKETYSKGRNSIVILNAPSDYSHVKSRLFAPTPNANSVSRSSAANSPTPNRRIKPDNEDVENENASNKQDQDGKENYSKSRSNVVIFNAPSDYSHVKSRLLATTANANSVNESSASNTPTPKRRMKTDNEEDVNNNDVVSSEQDQENRQNPRNRSTVKIFNAPTDYSHVKSRLYDSNGNKSDAEGQKSQRFKRKVNQMRSFGVLKHNNSDTQKPPNNVTQVKDQKDSFV